MNPTASATPSVHRRIDPDRPALDQMAAAIDEAERTHPVFGVSYGSLQPPACDGVSSAHTASALCLMQARFARLELATAATTIPSCFARSCT